MLYSFPVLNATKYQKLGRLKQSNLFSNHLGTWQSQIRMTRPCGRVSRTALQLEASQGDPGSPHLTQDNLPIPRSFL